MGPRRAWHRRWVPAAPVALRAGSGPSSVTGGLHRGSRAAAGGGDGENQGETAGAALRSPGHRKRSLQENRPGGPGAAPGRHRGCGAHGGSAPPPSRRGSFGLSPALGRGTCVCWGKKRKKITHMHKKCVFCARGLGGVTVSVQKSWRRCQSPPAILPHPRSSAPAPTEPLQGSAGARRGLPGAATTQGKNCGDRSSRGDGAESGPLGAAHGEEPAVIYGGEQRSYVFSVIQLLFN